VRLAFAVAAHLEPDILIVDEVLAVGDAVFQKKCLAKMGDVAKQGRTVLFVSHNMAAVTSLCGRCLVLDAGKVVADDSSEKAVAVYLRPSRQLEEKPTEKFWALPETAPGNENIRVRRVVVRPPNGESSSTLDMCTPFLIEIDYWQLKPTKKTYFDLVLYADDGTCILNSVSAATEGRIQSPGSYHAEVELPAPLLNSGGYRVRLQFLDEDLRSLYEQPDLAFFTIHDPHARDIPWFHKFWGVIHPDLKWHSLKVE
jgi:lipopolysaccharide transport system ATP-binding protein